MNYELLFILLHLNKKAGGSICQYVIKAVKTDDPNCYGITCQNCPLRRAFQKPAYVNRLLELSLL